MGKTAYLVQFTLDKRRRSVFLDSRYPKRVAQEVSLYVDELARAVEFGLTPERRGLNWLEEIGDDLQRRLQRGGLLPSRNKLTIAELVKKYFEAEKGKFRPATLENKHGALKRAAKRLDFSQSAEELTPTDVLRLKDELERATSSVTCAGTLKVLSRVYSWGKTLELVPKNPFEQVTKGSMINKSREHYVSLDVYKNVLEHCANQTERTLLALYRIGGLRRGEAFEARWEDVDWDGDRMKVRSPKTGRAGKDYRVIPLFALLKEELEKLHREARRPKTGLIVEDVALTQVDFAIRGAIARSGEPIWERLWQNLRASRANEIYRKYGEVKESLWIGHTERVARNHYLHLLESDYAEAARWKEA